MNALVKKEIWDAIRWLPIGFLFQAIMIVSSLRSPSSFPGAFQTTAHNLYYATWISAALFGFFLSLMTFMREEREAARAFLVHRGIPLERIFWNRVAIGLVVYAVAMLVPLCATAVYLAIIGPTYAPVSPIQVIPACVAAVFCSAFYFCGVIIACRPSRWIGTRLLPLALAVLVAFSAIAFLEVEVTSLWITIVVLSIGSCGLVTLVMASRQAFLQLPFFTAPTERRAKSLALFMTLLLSSLICITPLLLFPVNFVHTFPQSKQWIRFSKDGEPWLATTPFITHTWPPDSGHQMKIRIRDPKNLLSEDALLAEDTAVAESDLNSSFGGNFGFYGFFAKLPTWDGQFLNAWENKEAAYLHPSGYIYFYSLVDSRHWLLKSIISSDRISMPGEPLGTPFSVRPQIEYGIEWSSPGSYLQPHSTKYSPTLPPNSPPKLNMQMAILDTHGLLFADLSTRSIRRVVTTELDSGRYFIDKPSSAFMIAKSKDTISIYKITQAEQNQQNSDAAQAETKLDVVLDGKFQVDGMIPYNNVALNYVDQKNWTWIDRKQASQNVATSLQVTQSKDGVLTTYEFPVPQDVIDATVRKNDEAAVAMFAMPPAFLLTLMPLIEDDSILTFHWSLIGCQMLLAGLVAGFTAYYRRLSTWRFVAWVVTGALLGLGTWLAIIAIYPRIFTIHCTHCGKRRRVDQEHCAHCRSEWELPQREGIEIFESDESQVAPAQPAVLDSSR